MQWIKMVIWRLADNTSPKVVRFTHNCSARNSICALQDNSAMLWNHRQVFVTIMTVSIAAIWESADNGSPKVTSRLSHKFSARTQICLCLDK